MFEHQLLLGFALMPVVLACVSCQSSSASSETSGDSASVSSVRVKLNPDDASPFNNGRFEGWGTALCWWANRLGYDELLTEQAAKLFFAEDGLGLDIGRYNIGGGDDPAHKHISRSDSQVPGYATGFDENGDIVYDWTVDQNQRNITLAALAANPAFYVEGFSNSPPWFMTVSGCSSGNSPADKDNLKADQYDNFAKYIAQVTRHFRDEFGIAFQSYSPINEPDTNYWGAYSNKQEGCHYDHGTSQSKILIATRQALDAACLRDVLVAGMDESIIEQTRDNLGRLSEEAKAALGRIDTHTYGGSDRAGVKAKAIEMGKDLWMSEVDGGGTEGSNPGDMGAGLWFANRILVDMNGMQPSAWVLWDIVDFHKDSTFTAPDGSHPEAGVRLRQDAGIWGVGMADHDEKKIYLTQKYYVFGQFTRYIHPGDTIIGSSNQQILAAYNKESGAIKIVAVNADASLKNYTFDLSNFGSVPQYAKAIRTRGAFDGGEHWKDVAVIEVKDKQFSFALLANSVTTFVIDWKKPEIPGYITVAGLTDTFVGETSAYIAQNSDGSPVTWSVSDKTIATISADGLLTPLKEGSVSVTARSEKFGLEDSVNVAVLDIRGLSKVEIAPEQVTGSVPWNGQSNANNCKRVVDGNLESFFDGLIDGYVTLDLEGAYKIEALKYAPRPGFEYRVTGSFYGSADGINWDAIYTVSSTPASKALTAVYARDFAEGVAGKAYRYIKYATYGTGDSHNCNIAEIEVWQRNGEAY
ncbi:MAG: Ig-like domain-containing protein [Treponema sp.]|nr:Ig-like domain-containing protein [Treponema sp.]